MTSQDSYIETTAGSATTFVGPDAVGLFRATVIANAIRLYLRTGMKASRAYTPQAMRDTASAVTGRAYPRSRRGLELAAFDLDTWCKVTASQIPVVDGNRVSLTNMNPAAMAAAARNAKREE